jgi:tetratricopeptide (TPR) repeat protein
MRKLGIFLALGLTLSACASSKSATKAPQGSIGAGVDVETMRPAEAAQVLKEFRTAYGFERPPLPDPKIGSMAQVLDIILHDQIGYYDAARQFTAGKTGAEALTVRAYLELRQLQQPRALSTADEDRKAAEAQAAAALQTETEDFRKAVRALRVLSVEPMNAGGDLANQAIDRDPNLQLGYLAKAMYFRMTAEWLEFDRMMKYADDIAADPPVRTYLRGMEAYERYTDRESAKKLLEEALVKNPELVRAQANLVLVETDIADKYAALQKLKAMSPNHLVVGLAGKDIESEYRTAMELRGRAQPTQTSP